MLDLATGLTKTSRLGCQVRSCCSVCAVNGRDCEHHLHVQTPTRVSPTHGTVQVVVTAELGGMVVTLPKEVSNMQNK